jgi:hypothetical protein
LVSFWHDANEFLAVVLHFGELVSALWAVGCLGSLGSILRLGLGDVGPSIQGVGIADTVRLIQIVLIADQGAARVVRRVTFDGLAGRTGSASRRRADSYMTPVPRV